MRSARAHAAAASYHQPSRRTGATGPSAEPGRQHTWADTAVVTALAAVSAAAAAAAATSNIGAAAAPDAGKLAASSAGPTHPGHYGDVHAQGFILSLNYGDRQRGRKQQRSSTARKVASFQAAGFQLPNALRHKHEHSRKPNMGESTIQTRVSAPAGGKVGLLLPILLAEAAAAAVDADAAGADGRAPRLGLQTHVPGC